jgi:hypothetical protein
MASITSWTRLEPITGRKDIEVGLQARVHDPLWMLARQWQVGEFRAEDAGSPVVARMRGEVAKVTRYAAGAVLSTTLAARDYDGGIPLEAFVERELVASPLGSARNLRLSAETGHQFLLMLGRRGLTKYRDAFVRSFLLEDAATGDDDDARAYAAIVARRTIDGVRLFEALRAARRPADGPTGFPPEPPIDSADLGAAGEVADAFLAWYQQFVNQPEGNDASAWTSERMEYAFALSAAASDGETVLAAREYIEGSLDWHAFDCCPGASLGADAARAPASTVVRTVMPAPVSYRGMPAARWWEFEDAVVDFGSVEAQPSDLVRLLMLDFVISYSSDWFIVPVELDVGSICSVSSLVVVDTFGEQTLIAHYTEVDGSSGKWHLFRNSVDARFAGSAAPSRSRLFLAPTLGGSLSGRPIEEVLLLRDELANLAFAVERVVAGAGGGPVNRFEQFQTTQSRPGEAGIGSPAPVSGVPYRYRLATQIPDHWIPLVPMQDEDRRSIRFRRGRLLAPSGGSTTAPMPRGQVLEPGRPLSVFEEEIPRSGARITRAWQLARWVDGSTHLWIGRRKLSGRGEGSSGLRFDVLEMSDRSPASLTD